MTLPHPASQVPASEPALTDDRSAPLGDLICDPDLIFDTTSVRAEIDRAAQDTSDNAALRMETVRVLKAAQKAGRAQIASAFADAPFAARALTRSYTFLTDGLVTTTLYVARRYLHPLATPTNGERIALIAVGGYGRGEMAPASDVDLLFLTPYKITAWAESLIESMLYMLWDLRLKVGHASRTIDDCLRLGTEDYTIRTALLEQRYLAGDRDLAQELSDSLNADLFKGTGRDFIAAKLAEREIRHEKQGQRYMVEPNVKEGKGGLRDLQSLFWIAKYIHGVLDPEELVPLGVFRPEEYDRFVQAADFLWAVRSHMHLATGRATEQLTFDLQVEVASRMGYRDRAGRRGVEIFMQQYFREATAVGELSRIFLTKLETTYERDKPLLQRIFSRTPRVRKGFTVLNTRLAIADVDEFFEDNLNILRLFQEGLRTGLLIHPDAMRDVALRLDLINDKMRNDREAQRLFLDILLKHDNPERGLRRMNELGVLSAFIPEFEPIVAMMQFNMYHSYTVDEHTLQCIRNLAEIEKGEKTDDLPLASQILSQGVNRKVLYVALLLHDIGKGRPEDHSILGAQIARKVAPRLGLKKAEAETVEWLVRYHLLMSDMAQKRDISDPRTVRDFAKAVKSVERLDLLTVLTVCDIRGVGPTTWNNWKATLIRSLHSQTRRAMEDGMEDLNRENRGVEAQKNLRAALPDWNRSALRKEVQRHYDPYWQGLHVTAHVDFAELLRDLEDGGDDGGIELRMTPDEDRDATRACMAMVDHPGIFARLTGALALVGANIVDARSYTTRDGYVTGAFWIQDHDGAPYELDRLPRLTQMIHKTLRGEVLTQEALKSRDKIKKREKAFNVPTHITFDNEGSEIYTIIEVDTRDRPGLLYDLARAMAAANIYIANAVIATYGEQVVDTFYVKDMAGMKYHAASKQKQIEDKLRKAITEGAERALGK